MVNNKLYKFLLFILVLIFGFLLLFYFQSTRTDKSQISEEFKPESYTLVEESDEIVSNFPEFPKYPGAKVVSSYKKAENNNVGYEAKFQVESTVPVVMSWYIETLNNQGWEIEESPYDLSILGEQFLVAKKKGLALYLTIENEDRDEIVEIYAEFPVR